MRRGAGDVKAWIQKCLWFLDDCLCTLPSRSIPVYMRVPRKAAVDFCRCLHTPCPCVRSCSKIDASAHLPHSATRSTEISTSCTQIVSIQGARAVVQEVALQFGENEPDHVQLLGRTDESGGGDSEPDKSMGLEDTGIRCIVEADTASCPHGPADGSQPLIHFASLNPKTGATDEAIAEVPHEVWERAGQGTRQDFRMGRSRVTHAEYHRKVFLSIYG